MNIKLPNWLRYIVYGFLIGVVAWSFLKPKEKEFVNAIIRGTDTMIVSGGVNVSKCHATAGYWNKRKDTFFHVFTNPLIIGDGLADTAYIWKRKGIVFSDTTNYSFYKPH